MVCTASGGSPLGQPSFLAALLPCQALCMVWGGGRGELVCVCVCGGGLTGSNASYRYLDERKLSPARHYCGIGNRP